MMGSVLVANRGEIARRIIRTCKRLGVRTIAVHSDADAGLPFVTEADEAVLLGPAAPDLSYRNTEAILAAAKATGAEAIHPGYGFLAENAAFARAVADHGLIWIGPSPEAITAMGDKINARNLMAAAGVPVAPGTPEPVATVEDAVTEAARIGYPVMVKASAGGGGMGMGSADDEAALRVRYAEIRASAERLYKDGSVLIERYFPRVRHIEVQILGLADGRVIALGERECSVQRRNQKVLEETPSPAVDADLRRRLMAAAVRAGEAVGYRSAGTVEFLFAPAESLDGRSAQGGDFFFLEMNTRLQVEHPITELVYRVDLVEEQLRVASGMPPGFDVDAIEPRGHAIELRVNAEDPKRFMPGAGAVLTWVEPTGDGIRVDAGYAAGTTVTPNYDSLMAKLIVFAEDRPAAIAKARRAAAEFEITGPKCNLPLFEEVLDNPEFVSGDYDTGLIGRMRAPKPKQ